MMDPILCIICKHKIVPARVVGEPGVFCETCETFAQISLDQFQRWFGGFPGMEGDIILSRPKPPTLVPLRTSRARGLLRGHDDVTGFYHRRGN